MARTHHCGWHKHARLQTRFCRRYKEETHIKIAGDTRPGTAADVFEGYVRYLKDAGKPSWKETEKGLNNGPVLDSAVQEVAQFLDIVCALVRLGGACPRPDVAGLSVPPAAGDVRSAWNCNRS